MLENYFKIAWRNLVKRRFFSLVSILGLAAGMTFTFLIASYVWGELQVNTSLKNATNQYILQSKWKEPDMGVEIATLGPLGRALKEEYPNLVANYYRYDGITVAVSNGEKNFREEVQAGDSTLLSMYGFPLTSGDRRTALAQPNAIVLTEEKALKYFGSTEVLGKTLTLDNFIGGKQEFRITAVLKDLPDNSATNLLKSSAGVFIPLLGLNGRTGAESWSFPYMVTFIELRDGVTREDLAKPILQLLATNTPENIRSNLSVSVIPLKQFYREQNNGLVQKMVYTLLTVALFILLMAIVNFVNIAIGNSASRLKEIGVRKVLGSRQKQLIFQFLAESFILAFTAMLLSLIFYALFRPYFETMLGKRIGSVFSLLPGSLLFALLIAAVTALLAGIYPAFLLSSLPAIESVKGKLKSVKDNILFRRVLITSQFSIALFVFVAAALISRQVDYFFSKDLGYNKESIVAISTPRDWTPEGVAKMEGTRNVLSHLKEVDKVSLSYEIPNGNFGGNTGLYKPGQDSTQAIYTQILSTDELYADTYQLKLVAGTFFNAGRGVYQPDQIVINEETARALGFQHTQEAVGQQIKMHSNPTLLTIGGVIKNFHFESMHKEIKPLAFVHIRSAGLYRFLSFKIPPGNIAASLAAIEAKWRELMPGTAFEYHFMDDTLEKLYKSEMQLKSASRVATILAVIIVLLGILGTVSLNVSRRTKELGIRKVLGASSASLMMLFLKEFLVVLALAMMAAFPLAFFVMHRWLQLYAYRVDISWTSFVLVGLIVAAAVASLVSLITYKSTRLDPVKAIRMD
jgi:putative ABC transport system permease protein